jgi:hypothetical protein
MFHTHNQIGMGGQGQVLQCFIKVSRTDFTGSTGPVNRFRQTDYVFRHPCLLFVQTQLVMIIELILLYVNEEDILDKAQRGL